MLDSTDLAPYKHPQGSAAHTSAMAILAKYARKNMANAKPWNGGIGEAQFAWIERELAAATAAGDRVILCGHHPVLPANGHEIWNATEVVKLIDDHPCVIAFFNGHNHAGAEVVNNGVPYITFKSILKEPQITAYSMVTVTGDKITIAGRGREASRAFPVRPAK